MLTASRLGFVWGDNMIAIASSEDVPVSDDAPSSPVILVSHLQPDQIRELSQGTPSRIPTFTLEPKFSGNSSERSPRP